jgi:transposase, IS6 family
MRDASPFKWRHFEADIILCAVRWYLRYALSYRDIEELLRERGISVDHTTVFRWVQRYAPELDQRCRPHLSLTNDSYRVDETYIRIKKQWHYLYRAVDSLQPASQDPLHQCAWKPTVSSGANHVDAVDLLAQATYVST